MKKELIINKSNTIIVILAGGQSRRFGGGYKTLYKLNLKNNEVLSQDIIFEDLIGRIRDIEVNSIGELFLINSNNNASLWKMSKE